MRSTGTHHVWQQLQLYACLYIRRVFLDCLPSGESTVLRQQASCPTLPCSALPCPVQLSHLQRWSMISVLAMSLLLMLPHSQQHLPVHPFDFCRLCLGTHPSIIKDQSADCRALRVVNPSPYMVYLQAEGSILVASSPEILCRLDHDRMVTNR